MDTSFDRDLTDEETELVADLAGAFSDQWRMGQKPSICAYLDRLRDERLRQEFIEIVNMDRLLMTLERAKAS